MPELKIGDKVKAYTGHSRLEVLDKKGGAIYGEVLEPPCRRSDVMTICTPTGGKHYVFVSTAELLSAALPLPTPIDWAKPVRWVAHPEAKWRVLCTDAPGDFPVRVMLMTAIDNVSCPGTIFSRQLDGATQSGNADMKFENVPPPLERRKVWLYLHKNVHTGFISCNVHPSDWKPESNKILAMCEVELTEGEGME